MPFQTLAMEFRPYDSFRPYETPQLQPFSPVPNFEEKSFDAYGPGPQPPNVQMPEYEERPYGSIKPPQEPDVQMQTGPFRQYKPFKPMAPIDEGPMREMKPEQFEGFKPLGEE